MNGRVRPRRSTRRARRAPRRSLGGGGSRAAAVVDRIAAQGVQLTDFYANAPICTPTRAGFMTGRWQQRLGLEFAFAQLPVLATVMKKTYLFYNLLDDETYTATSRLLADAQLSPHKRGIGDGIATCHRARWKGDDHLASLHSLHYA